MDKLKPVVLVVLDGWGYRDAVEHNAIYEGHTPFWDFMIAKYPHALLDASGLAVGLPDGQAGNSEIGHMVMGAGKPLDTDVVRITKAAQHGEFAQNAAFQQLFEHVKKHDATLHIQGLVSPGGVHSHHDHLFAFLRAAKDAGLTKIAVHAFTDGRDTPPQSAKGYLKELESVVEEAGIGHIATATGRYYAMDRDNNWDRLAKFEEALYECKGKVCQLRKPSDMLEELYQEGALDEHLEPLVFLDDKGNGYPLQKNDGVLIFNFRSDRARMLARRMSDKARTDNLCVVTMTQYDESIDCLVAFPPVKVEQTLSKTISDAGLSQIHIAETEKYAHATYFLNVGNETRYQNEEWVLVDSRKDVATHDQAPEMRAAELTDKALELLQSQQPDFMFINFANADMVGHTANKEATLKAVEAVDMALSRLAPAVTSAGGIVLITADHGNAETNVDPDTGVKHTAHTSNPVPLILTKTGVKVANGTLADVAPTILYLLNIHPPSTMTGKNLLLE